MKRRGKSQTQGSVKLTPEKPLIRHVTRGEVKRKLSRNLRSARRKAGLSQAELAERSGVSRSTIAAIEEARRLSYTGTFFRLSFGLNVPPSTLFKGL